MDRFKLFSFLKQDLKEESELLKIMTWNSQGEKYGQLENLLKPSRSERIQNNKIIPNILCIQEIGDLRKVYKKNDCDFYDYMDNVERESNAAPDEIFECPLPEPLNRYTLHYYPWWRQRQKKDEYLNNPFRCSSGIIINIEKFNNVKPELISLQQEWIGVDNSVQPGQQMQIKRNVLSLSMDFKAQRIKVFNIHAGGSAYIKALKERSYCNSEQFHYSFIVGDFNQEYETLSQIFNESWFLGGPIGLQTHIAGKQLDWIVINRNTSKRNWPEDTEYPMPFAASDNWPPADHDPIFFGWRLA